MDFMRYYPIGLDILDRRCLVVGGGEVGQRKAERLLECGARVTVVGRELTPGLEGLVREGRIGHIAADYAEDHLEGAFLVIGATDDRAVNDRIFGDARRRRVLANIVDDPGRCELLADGEGRPLVLFESEWHFERAKKTNPKLAFAAAVQPARAK